MSEDQTTCQIKQAVSVFKMTGVKEVSIGMARCEKNMREGKLLWNNNDATEENFWFKEE